MKNQRLYDSLQSNLYSICYQVMNSKELNEELVKHIETSLLEEKSKLAGLQNLLFEDVKKFEDKMKVSVNLPTAEESNAYVTYWGVIKPLLPEMMRQLSEIEKKLYFVIQVARENAGYEVTNSLYNEFANVCTLPLTPCIILAYQHDHIREILNYFEPKKRQ